MFVINDTLRETFTVILDAWTQITAAAKLFKFNLNFQQLTITYRGLVINSSH